MQPMIDINNEHQNRQKALDKAISNWNEVASHIGRIEGELHSLNDHLDIESKEREKEDKKNRRMTVIAVFLTCAITFFFDHVLDLFHLLFSN